jgi:hypothetical protein
MSSTIPTLPPMHFIVLDAEDGSLTDQVHWRIIGVSDMTATVVLGSV